MRTVRVVAVVAGLAFGLPTAGNAQNPEVVGTRAQGMGGAFVGVADDASAVFWNPAGLAGGAYFSLVLDGSGGRSVPDEGPGAASRSGWLLALSTPALGLSYYRLQSKALRPLAGAGSAGFRLESLVTQHVGATLVQSLTDGLAVGTTLKIIRGVAASAELPAGDREELLDRVDLMGRSGNRLDLDVGLMATGALGRAGVTIRNVTEPSFDTGSGLELALDRQIRAGASILLLQTWKLAADLDLTKHLGPIGDVREFALGTEGQVTRRVAARAGLRLNTTGEQGRTPSMSLGASFAVFGALLLDGQVTHGSDKSFNGWGLGGRMVF